MNSIVVTITILIFFIISTVFVCIKISDRDKIYYQYMAECIKKGRHANDCKFLFSANKYKE